ncbi:MAG: diguanylate cyclase, partial [Spirochaetes bacterium]|nr:diguanylate cyclase [Spirochaetota bacterium]
ILGFERGPWYFVHLAYSYGIFLYGIVVFAKAIRYGNATRRAQARFMLAGTLVPIAANAVYALGLSPASIDMTPVAFAVSGAFFSAGFFKYRLFDLRHIARDSVFEHMREAAVVIGEGGAIVDYNRAAAALFPMISAKAPGLTFAALSESRPSLFSALSRGDGRDTIALAAANGDERFFETHRSRVLDKDGRKLGVLLMLHDVTERELLQERLRELASLDELTRIANRRHFYELAGIELERARRHGRAIGFAVMDMNGFKGINDLYGHRAGDDALRLAARLCVDALRSCDIVGRTGGDEFAFVFPECDEAGAEAAVEKIRRVVNAATFSSGEDTVRISASFGFVGSPGPIHLDLEDLLSTADKRMYADKPVARAVKAAAARKQPRA